MAHRGVPMREVDQFNNESLRNKPSDILATPRPFGWKLIGVMLAIIVVGAFIAH